MSHGLSQWRLLAPNLQMFLYCNGRNKESKKGAIVGALDRQVAIYRWYKEEIKRMEGALIVEGGQYRRGGVD